MAELSPGDRDIIKNHPVTHSVDSLQVVLQEAENIYELRLISYKGAGSVDNPDQLYGGVTSGPLSALQGEDAAYMQSSFMDEWWKYGI
ncbi:hypothetical protein ACJ72_00626 [Emergomyces africanus]|uniref:Uncharacterized protein n=1 Tax=Emergomyces africanus TaxID=1955775 RepID=A0A1B7P7L8_9EURO|nr:hypothetical protein ACJ72_00626 [Emergomyces africanus]